MAIDAEMLFDLWSGQITDHDKDQYEPYQSLGHRQDRIDQGHEADGQSEIIKNDVAVEGCDAAHHECQTHKETENTEGVRIHTEHCTLILDGHVTL